MPKTWSKNLITLSPDTAENIAEALKAYATAAYPPGGSECSQATHQTLFDLANKIKILGPDGKLRLKKRQLPVMKTAINWYYSEDKAAENKQGITAQILLQQLELK